MSAWIIFLIVALVFFIIEIYTPAMFFLNFSIAAVVCAFIGIFTENYNILIPIFVVLSILFILFLRPLLNINPTRDKDSSLESQYVGKTADAISDVTSFSGRIKIYDEDWEARLNNDDMPEIKKGDKVKIIRHNDLTMYVEKLTKKGKKQ